MSIRLSGVVMLIAFWVVFGLLMNAGALGDLLVRAAIWSSLGLASLYVILRLLRGEAHSTDWTASLPAAIRRWLIGESGR